MDAEVPKPFVGDRMVKLSPIGGSSPAMVMVLAKRGRSPVPLKLGRKPIDLAR